MAESALILSGDRDRKTSRHIDCVPVPIWLSRHRHLPNGSYMEIRSQCGIWDSHRVLNQSQWFHSCVGTRQRHQGPRASVDVTPLRVPLVSPSPIPPPQTMSDPSASSSPSSITFVSNNPVLDQTSEVDSVIRSGTLGTQQFQVNTKLQDTTNDCHLLVLTHRPHPTKISSLLLY